MKRPIFILLAILAIAISGYYYFSITRPLQLPEPDIKPVPEMPIENLPATTRHKQEEQHLEPQVSDNYHHYCMRESFEEKPYIVCRAKPDSDKITLFLYNQNGKPFKRFHNIESALKNMDETLAFAMNAGMYHADYSAVGLYVEHGSEIYPLSTRDGPGNFHMKPNGIFFIQDGKAGVLDTESYKVSDIKPDLATQSGPMLVINNKIHPRFIPNSPFLEYRNGVGVTEDGNVIFVISEHKVNFDEMARFFRDVLKTPNALFFDGSISSLYSPEMKRYDWWHGMGPIIGVVIKKDTDSAD